MATTTTVEGGRIGELVRYFLRLGCLGFGGPVALVGQMERELVDGQEVAHQGADARSHRHLPVASGAARDSGRHLRVLPARRLLGRVGRRLVASSCRTSSSSPRSGALYVYLGDLQPVTAIFYGVSPAVIALILHSCYRLAKLGMEDWLQWAIAAVCLVVTVILQAEVALLFIGAGIVGILYYGSLFKRTPAALAVTAPVLAQLAPQRPARSSASCCCSSSRRARSPSAAVW